MILTVTRGKGSKNPEIWQTSFKYGPLLDISTTITALHFVTPGVCTVSQYFSSSFRFNVVLGSLVALPRFRARTPTFSSSLSRASSSAPVSSSPSSAPDDRGAPRRPSSSPVALHAASSASPSPSPPAGSSAPPPAPSCRASPSSRRAGCTLSERCYC